MRQLLLQLSVLFSSFQSKTFERENQTDYFDLSKIAGNSSAIMFFDSQLPGIISKCLIWYFILGPQTMQYMYSFFFINDDHKIKTWKLQQHNARGGSSSLSPSPKLHCPWHLTAWLGACVFSLPFHMLYSDVCLWTLRTLLNTQNNIKHLCISPRLDFCNQALIQTTSEMTFTTRDGILVVSNR